MKGFDSVIQKPAAVRCFCQSEKGRRLMGESVTCRCWVSRAVFKHNRRMGSTLHVTHLTTWLGVNLIFTHSLAPLQLWLPLPLTNTLRLVMLTQTAGRCLNSPCRPHRLPLLHDIRVLEGQYQHFIGCIVL